MKKFVILLVLASAAWFAWQQRQGPVRDAAFQRAVEHVRHHSGEKAVSRMAAESQTGRPFKPSDWLSRFLSAPYSAAATPMEPFDVIFLPWSFRENQANKDAYDSASRFLVIASDNLYNEIVVRGFKGWDGERLFEKRWPFPEIPGVTPDSFKKRSFLAAFFPERFKPAPPEDARYLLESGVVVYEVEVGASGGALDFRMKGEGELHFDDWGRREALYMQTLTDTVGIRDRTNTKRVTLGDTSYEIDYLRGTTAEESGEGIRAADYSDEALESSGGVRKDMREAAGRPCQMWQVGDDEICVWKQIPLMQESRLFGKRVAMRATEVHENEIIAERHFTIKAA